MGLRVDVEWRVPVGEVVRAVVGLRLRLRLGLRVRGDDRVSVIVRDDDEGPAGLGVSVFWVEDVVVVCLAVMSLVEVVVPPLVQV